MKYSHVKTQELLTRRVAYKMHPPPTEADVLIADLAAQLDCADGRILRQKAHIDKINREFQDE